jgi:hypothetical protein
MKKCLLLFISFFLVLITFSQSKEHFAIQKKVILKYKLTHNKKYIQQFINNWEKEIPEIPDSVIANWTISTINTYQVIQAIFDSSRYKYPDFTNSIDKNIIGYYPYLTDSYYLIIPSVIKFKLLSIKMNSFDKDSMYPYLNKTRDYKHQLTYFKPHIDNRKVLYLTEDYNKLLLKNKIILKKLNLCDYNYLKEKKKRSKQYREDKHKKITTYNYNGQKLRNTYYLEVYDGSFPANVDITFDRTYTFAFVSNCNDGTILVCQKKEGERYVVF